MKVNNCPYCGSSKLYTFNEGVKEEVRVQCEECNHTDSLEDWNRVIPSKSLIMKVKSIESSEYDDKLVINIGIVRHVSISHIPILINVKEVE